MSTNRILAAAAACALALASPDTASIAGVLSASATNAAGSSIAFHWEFYEVPEYPTTNPEWIGYDVLRRPVGCGEFTRVNEYPFARVFGVTHDYTFTEPAPSEGITYQYRVVLVDADRHPVFPQYCECAAHDGWASYPAQSAPLTEGTLEDWGWALFLQPAAGSCFQSFYFENRVDELRPLAGTGAVVRLYGDAYCGTVEGCGMVVDRYEIVPPNTPTAAGQRTWGQLKVFYR